MNLSKDIDAVKYSFYVIFHPFNGFWDLKHEKKGNYYSVAVILFFLVITFLLKNQMTGFMLSAIEESGFNLFFQITSVLIPFFVWCIANWSITTLVDGEGNFRDIVITTAYATVPLIIIQLPLVILSNYITISEIAFYNIFNTVSYLWFGFLLTIGIMTIHQFSVKKTLLTIIIALFVMIIIIFIFLIFFTLIQYITNFFKLIYNEIALRLYS